MATNLLIGYPQVINTSSVVLTSTYTLDTTGKGYPAVNLFGGGRNDTCRNATIANSYLEIIADLGSDTSVSWDYIIFSKVKAGKTWGATDLYVQKKTAAGSYSAAGGTTSLNSKTLYGPSGEDIVFTSEIGNSDSATLPISTTARYIKCVFGKTSGMTYKSAWELGKWYLGSWLDLGRDPVAITSGQSGIGGSERSLKYTFQIEWEGVSGTNKNSFVNYIANYPERGFFLYTKTAHDVLLNLRLLHCRLVEHSILQEVENSFSISATFEELI